MEGPTFESVLKDIKALRKQNPSFEITFEIQIKEDTGELAPAKAAVSRLPIDQSGALAKHHAREVQSLEGQITALKKDLAKETKWRLGLMESLSEVEQRRKDALYTARRLQLRLNTYERTRPRPMLLLPAHATPDATEPERLCDICSKPIPPERMYNAKRCSLRCDQIKLIRDRPRIMLKSPMLREIGIEEGLWQQFEAAQSSETVADKHQRQRAPSITSAEHETQPSAVLGTRDFPEVIEPRKGSKNGSILVTKPHPCRNCGKPTLQLFCSEECLKDFAAAYGPLQQKSEHEPQPTKVTEPGPFQRPCQRCGTPTWAFDSICPDCKIEERMQQKVQQQTQKEDTLAQAKALREKVLADGADMIRKQEEDFTDPYECQMCRNAQALCTFHEKMAKGGQLPVKYRPWAKV